MARKPIANRVTTENRRRLGIRAGDRIEIVAEDHSTIVRRASTPADPFAEFQGALGGFPKGKKQIDAWIRELRNPE